MAIFVSLIIGVSVAVFIWALFLFEKDINPNILQRLEKIKRKSNEDVELEQKVDFSFVSKILYQLPLLIKFLKKSKLDEKINNMLMLADSSMTLDFFIGLSLLCAIPFLLFLLTPFKLMTLFGFVTLFLPTMYVQHLVSKRFLDFSKQFPDALSMLASSLRAGHPLFSAIDIVTSEMPKPVSTVFMTVQRDIALGIDTKEAFYSMVKLMPQSLDLKFFITAVLVQKEVGGNLAELLDKLSITIRERFKLIGQLRAQTAQTRFSGIIVGIVPIVVILLIFFMNPEYIKPMFETQDGQLAFAGAILLIVAGFVSIKKISQIEI